MKVSPALRCLASCGSGAPTKESIEDTANTLKAKSLKAMPKEAFTTMSEAVIGGSLFRVREHFVGFVYLLELLLGPIILVMVGMILEGELTKSLLYLPLGSIFVYAEDFIIVALRRHFRTLFLYFKK